LPSTETKEVQIAGISSTEPQSSDPSRLRAWGSTFWQFIRYCLVGGVNTLLDLAVLNLFLWRLPTHNPQILVIYNSVAYTGGAVSSFFLNKYWTFRRTQRPTWTEVRRFVISLGLEVVYSNGLVWLAGKALQPVIANPTLWGNASKLLAVACSVIITFVFMRFWIFASTSRTRE
jgi:putative flippase GtrA